MPTQNPCNGSLSLRKRFDASKHTIPLSEIEDQLKKRARDVNAAFPG